MFTKPILPSKFFLLFEGASDSYVGFTTDRDEAYTYFMENPGSYVLISTKTGSTVVQYLEQWSMY